MPVSDLQLELINFSCLFRRYGGCLYGITSKHQVLIDYPHMDRLLSQGHHTLENFSSQLSLMVRIFGCPDTSEYRRHCELAVKKLLAVVEKQFVNDAHSTALLKKAEIHRRVMNLVAPSRSPNRQAPWQRAANTRLIAKDGPGSPHTIEVDLYRLICDFGAHVAIDVLYGKDFLDRNPHLLDDFWVFDHTLFPLLMVGVPSWAPFSPIRQGVAARSRLLSALQGLYRRIDQHQSAKAVDFGADMSDVGAAGGRNEVYSLHHIPTAHRAAIDLPFLWAQNANTQPLLFWLITLIHSSPGLLEKLRAEVAPWVAVTDAPFPEIESLDIDSVYRHCPLMKSALYETFRLCSEPTSIRHVVQPLSVFDGGNKDLLQPGTYISVSLAARQKDPLCFPNPEGFEPERFLSLHEDGSQVLRMGKLRPWSIGPGSCKGRTFAEKEILAIAAAIITVWEIEPVGGVWKVPRMAPGTGAKKPLDALRVRLMRRASATGGGGR